MDLKKIINNSDAFISLYTPYYHNDPTCLAQLGYAICKDIPIGLLVPLGILVPDSLQKVVKSIEYYIQGSEISLNIATKKLCDRMLRL